MKSNASSKIIISLVMLTVIAIAIIACSLAWFTASGSNTVSTNPLELDSATVSSMVIDTEALENYSRYMGQTGTAYDDYDSPYFLTYTPFLVDVSNLDLDKYGPYFCYNFSDLTQIKFIFSGAAPRPITAEESWNNFCMELHVAEKVVNPEANEEESEEPHDEYTETGVVYRSENGFFRNIDTGELLSFADEASQVFVLYIYFQSDVARKLLMDAQADIDEKYAFEFSDEVYMFSTFTLSAVFNMSKMHRLSFLSNGYDMDDDNKPIYLSDSNTYVYTSTGCNLYDAAGTEQPWPIAEFYSSEGGKHVDYSYYFVDWASRERDLEAEQEEYNFFIYRAASISDEVYTLAVRPLRADNSILTALCKQSPKLILDLGISGEDDVECYMRPQGTKYTQSARATYDSDNQRITVTNPTITTNNSNQCTESSATSFTYTPPAREGYYFVGWSATSTPTYNNGVLVSAFGNNGFTISQDKTIYAVWKELAYIDVCVPLVWGNNYATISDIVLLDGAGNEVPRESTSNNTAHYRLQAEKGTSAYEALQHYTATGTATFSDQSTRDLTLKGFTFYKNEMWVTLASASGKDFNLAGEDSVILIWNERQTYSITVDLFQAWSARVGTLVTDYTVGSQYKITSAIEDTYRSGNESGGYTILFNGSKTIDYTATPNNTATITISNIPEGMKLSDVLTADPEPKNCSGGGYLVISYDFSKWSTTNNNWSETTLSTYLKNADKINVANTVVNDAFLATLTNNTIYVLIER